MLFNDVVPDDAAPSRPQPELRPRVEVEEDAPWFGATGLPADVERHVPRYVRLEFGESLGDPGALEASDLEYVGSFSESVSRVYYWRIPSSTPDLYAHVEVQPDGSIYTSMGERTPPQ
jgi:hypothetical protein